MIESRVTGQRTTTGGKFVCFRCRVRAVEVDAGFPAPACPSCSGHTVWIRRGNPTATVLGAHLESSSFSDSAAF